ncbi:MAG: hypothetical protein ABSG73_13165 [Candidatus Aminicenantales bacterium]|jgi:hypothetical protein
MLKKIAALAALGVFCVFAVAQTKPPDYTVKDGIAEWRSPDKTIDQVWSAVQRVLMRIGYRTKTADKAGGVLEAICNYSSSGFWASQVNVKEDELSAISIIFNAHDGITELSVRWRFGLGGPRSQKWLQKDYKIFFDDLAEYLK